ncbi:MAG: HEAT repeat domain-containing protein [Bacteroidetes bacterium]|nr:HEAT repeat domain-containing protein [Bacteroidota bacterium]
MEFIKDMLVQYLIPITAVAFMIFVAVVLINRYVYEENKLRVEEIKMRASEFITNLLFVKSDEGYGQILDELKRELPFKKKFVKEILLDTLVHYQLNLKGGKKEMLNKIYEDLHLNKLSESYIKDSRWHQKSLGIYHFQVFNYTKGIELIRPYLYHSNEKLRSDAFVSFLSLTSENIEFLADYNKKIGLVDELKIVDLIQSKKFSLPSNIDKWILSSNESIVRIGLKLMGFYNHNQNAGEIIKLLNSPSRTIRYEAILAIKKLSISNAEDSLIDLYDREDKLNKLAILDALSEIGSAATVNFLDMLLHQNHFIDSDEKIKIVSSLNTIDSDYFIANFAEDKDIDLIRKHVANLTS